MEAESERTGAMDWSDGLFVFCRYSDGSGEHKKGVFGSCVRLERECVRESEREERERDLRSRYRERPVCVGSLRVALSLRVIHTQFKR